MSAPFFKTIVVATDGSPTAAQAIAKGVELAQTLGSELRLVGAYESSKDQQRLETALSQAADGVRAAGLDVETYARSGDPVDVVIDTAKEVGADLIIVGNLGMQSAKRFLLAPIPDKISHRAECSVLVANTTG